MKIIKNLKDKILLVILISGNIGIVTRLYVITGQTFKIEIPKGAGGIIEALPFGFISYFDWLFIALSCIIPVIMYWRKSNENN